MRLQAPEGSYVYFAHMLSPSESTRFNDNYIDLQPGEAREVEVCDPVRPLQPGEWRLGFA